MIVLSTGIIHYNILILHSNSVFYCLFFRSINEDDECDEADGAAPDNTVEVESKHIKGYL